MNAADSAGLLLSGIEVAGALAFAPSGFIEATRKRMDIGGAAAGTLFSAFGGCTRR